MTRSIKTMALAALVALLMPAAGLADEGGEKTPFDVLKGMWVAEDLEDGFSLTFEFKDEKRLVVTESFKGQAQTTQATYKANNDGTLIMIGPDSSPQGERFKWEIDENGKLTITMNNVGAITFARPAKAN